MTEFVWIGLIATSFTSLQFIPQVIKAYQSKSLNDFSGMTIFMIITGCIFWLVYGSLIADLPILITNGIILACGIMLLMMKIKYK
jgi:MtN3 and saliva related transmembrane protein